MRNWHYSGDADPAYGGVWIDLDDWQWGYVTAVRVTDLDSGCGFTGAVLVEHVVINGTTDPKRIRKAFGCWGHPSFHRPARCTPAEWKTAVRSAIAEALLSYGSYDQDDSWWGMHSNNPVHQRYSELLQLEADGPMVFDGWEADKRLHNTDLKSYVESVHLD